MANQLSYATLFQNELDKAACQEMLTGWMDANAGKIKYTGGKEVKIPQLSVDGLGDYGRHPGSGYSDGNIQFEYKTYSMRFDRGRRFSFDALDVDESAFMITAGNVMGEFQRTQVIPEIDALRLSELAKIAIDTGYAEYNYTPSDTTIIRKIKDGIRALREAGYNGQLVIHANYDVQAEVEMAGLGKLAAMDWSSGGINTKVPAIDRCPIIETQQNRLYTNIKLLDGKTSGQEQGGYTKADDGKDINFIIIATSVPVAVTKQDVMRIFDPLTNQAANAWSMDYRRFHDIWVLDNKRTGIFVNIKDAANGRSKTAGSFKADEETAASTKRKA